jgi:hypothetical protein
MFRRSLIFSIIILTGFQLHCQTIQDSLHVALESLDNVISNKQQYTQARINVIHKTERKLKYATTDEDRYKLLDQVCGSYKDFNIDSAEVYALRLRDLASKMGDRKSVNYANLNLADVYSRSGFYVEALNVANKVDKRVLDDNQVRFYFHVYRALYGYISDYMKMKDSRTNQYAKMKDVYRDSLINVQDHSSYYYDLIRADAMVDHGQYEGAMKLLLPWVHKCDSNMVRTLGYTLAMAYRQVGDKDREAYFLAISAINDLKAGTKEYLSLVELSDLLYKQGDLDRAYNYLKCSLEDAVYCDASLRTIEVSEIYLIVDKAYQQKLQKKNRQRTIATAFITVLAIILTILLFYLIKQRNRLAMLHKSLIDLNEKLKKSNESLLTSNTSLSESNEIKETIISRYMELCSFYIEKISEYQHSLIKIATNQNVEKLFSALRSSEFIDDILKDFYLDFDKTFLTLFPTFVEDLNKLLVPEGQIHPKVPGQLNVELRIFALVRLGISDSSMIAKFLRYSVTTIYNYRVKVRNNAKGERNEFEKDVMDIAKS